MPTDVAAQQEYVPRPHGLRSDVQVVLDDPDAGRVHEDAVRLAALDDLRVAGDDVHRGLARRVANRAEHALQRLEREPLLEDQAAGQPERTGAAHGEVVHRAVHRELPDVTAREEQRGDDVRVRRERQAAPVHAEDRSVVVGLQLGVREPGRDRLLDEPVHQAASASVAEQHLRAVLARDGTRKGELAGLDHRTTSSTRFGRYR